MSTDPARGPAPVSSPAVRPLPSRPSLEYERKQAKRLLARAHRGDREALARVRAQVGDRATGDPGALRLADAQFAIAREYEFRSWPRMVEYLVVLERHVATGIRNGSYGREMLESRVRRVVAWHGQRARPAGKMIAAFVPRFYGAPLDEIFAAELTEDEARLVVAREARAPSWEALLEHRPPHMSNDWELFLSPAMRATDAIRNQDLATLERMIAGHPELLDERVPGEPHKNRLAAAAIAQEQKNPGSEPRRITDWLAAQGVDVQGTLSAMLIPVPPPEAEWVRFLLDRGADPNWLPPNGISILEHALVRYWSGDLVDLIATRVVPKKAFWIAAGLGDTRSVARYFDGSGNLMKAARQHRPDFTAIGRAPTQSLPNADDREIMWEAFYIAAINQRFAVLDLLLERGFPIDYDDPGSTLLHFAVGNGMAPLVEFLVRRGASLEVKGTMPHASAREMAEIYFRDSRPRSPDRYRILQLVGARDAEALLRERAAQAPRPVPFAPMLQQALQLARADAARLQQDAVTVENLFVASIQGKGQGLPLVFLRAGGADLRRLHELLAERLDTSAGAEQPPDLPLDADAARIMRLMEQEAERHQSRGVGTLHLVYVLAHEATGQVAELFGAVGVDREKLRAELERVL